VRYLTGEPTPEVSWYKDKKKVEKSKRTKMEMKEDIGVCTLEISDATTEDSGEYTVQLSNEVIHTHSLSPYSLSEMLQKLSSNLKQNI